MKKYTRVRIISLLACLAGLLLMPGCRNKKADVAPYIVTLDSLIEKSNSFEREKLMRIDNIRRRLNSAGFPSERYSLNSMLFDEFSSYRSDSAFKYIDRNIDIARQEGDKELLYQSYIKKAELFTATGMLSHAANILDSINVAELTPRLLTDYYGQKIYLYSHVGNYMGVPGNEYYTIERNYKDTIMSTIDSGHPEFLWYKGLDILGTDKPAEPTIEALEKNLSHSRFDNQTDAKLAYILAKLYQQTGDKKNYKKYMALSAASDIRFYNQRELSSLEELARLLYEEDDLARAFGYVNYCLARAISYPNRVKIFGVSDALDVINNSYQKRMLEEQEEERRTLVVICILAAVLAIAIVINVFQYFRVSRQKRNLDESNRSLSEYIKELHASQEQLNDANRKLSELNSDLKEKNYELDEANYVKEEYICSVFTLCSSYIGRISELKKNIHLNLLNKKYREIERETEDFDTRVDLKEFYHAFDSLFLHIYPDFVKDFNNLLQEDKRIYPKEGELLNTELRIYALIRLGITDSVKIAEFLHCSPQTVYNNRFKVRTKAIVPREQFADTVRKLGRFQSP